MKTITALFAAAVCVSAVTASEVKSEVDAGFGLVRDIRIYTSCCNNCGMTPLGTIGVKVRFLKVKQLSVRTKKGCRKLISMKKNKATKNRRLS